MSSNTHKPVYPYKDVYLNDLLFEVDEPTLERCDKVALQKIEDLQLAHNDLYKSQPDKVPEEDLEKAPVYLNHLYRLTENGEKEMYRLWNKSGDITKKILEDVKVISKKKAGEEKLSWKRRAVIYAYFLATMFAICGIFYLINLIFPWYDK